MSAEDQRAPLLAIFVGGGSTRMGGAPKGLLRAPDTGETLVDKLVRVGREAGMRSVLVGDAAPYESLGYETLDDDPSIAGPLGGLAAVLDHAADGQVIAVACDMPHVTVETLRVLAEHSADAEIVASRRSADGPWEPLLARYDAPRVLRRLRAAAADGARSFQALFALSDVSALALSASLERALVDWDRPEDVG